jgi:Desulfoferrodoxin, N-terminal domain
MSNLMGKRYQCATCGGQMMCTKAGDGKLECCGNPMESLEPKPLPSAD